MFTINTEALVTEGVSATALNDHHVDAINTEEKQCKHQRCSNAIEDRPRLSVIAATLPMIAMADLPYLVRIDRYLLVTVV
ncbi:hypothetical protein DPMN_124806 [Dreissena polymorpha]|uniref:Uncharacterized protein n=1 Tax=Dreissena polymorpha TaxID=45954 RepID=A0A9D4JSW9_DREPO|nr:hypothetical protein DPMN_124806 [Dreissena polymorpha]